MTTQIYTMPNLTFFIIKDSGEIVYNSEKEKLRANFLVKLIEERGYQEKDIKLDIEVGDLGFIDLVVYKNDKPFIIIDVREPNQNQTDEQVINNLFIKAQKLDVPYVALISRFSRRFFKLSMALKSISVLPFATDGK